MPAKLWEFKHDSMQVSYHLKCRRLLENSVLLNLDWSHFAGKGTGNLNSDGLNNLETICLALLNISSVPWVYLSDIHRTQTNQHHSKGTLQQTHESCHNTARIPRQVAPSHRVPANDLIQPNTAIALPCQLLSSCPIPNNTNIPLPPWCASLFRWSPE